MTYLETELWQLLEGYEERFPHNLLRDFPHVIQGLESRWEDEEAMDAYFTDLLVPNRPNRKGFPPEVAAEIFALSMVYGEARRRALEVPVDTWHWEFAEAREELEQLGVARTPVAFAKAAEAGDQRTCMLLLAVGVDVNCRDVREWTPLMIASFNGHELLALGLLLHGADVRAEDRGGYTPVHWAAFNGYPKVIRLLLREGGRVNAIARSGITPLHQASARGKLATVNVLLDGGADPNIAANDGTTPLIKAVANRHTPVVESLLAAGASVDVVMRDGTRLADIASHSPSRGIRKRIGEAVEAARTRRSA